MAITRALHPRVAKSECFHCFLSRLVKMLILRRGSLAVFQYTTGFELDHANPPIMTD